VPVLTRRGQVEQTGRETCQANGVALRLAQSHAIVGEARVVALHDVELSAERGKRRSEFMGRHGDEETLALDGLGDPVQHPIQGVGQPADLIHPERLVEPTREVTGTQRRGVVDQPIHGPKGASGQQPAAEQGRRADGQSDPQQQPRQRGLRVGDRFEVGPGRHDRAAGGCLGPNEVVPAPDVEDAISRPDAARCVGRGIARDPLAENSAANTPGTVWSDSWIPAWPVFSSELRIPAERVWSVALSPSSRAAPICHHTNSPTMTSVMTIPAP